MWIISRRGWGYVYDTEHKWKINGAFVRVFDEKESRQIDVQMTDEQGRYGFMVKTGSYLLKSDAPGYDFPSVQQRRDILVKTASGAEFLKIRVKQGQRPDLIIGLDPNKEIKGMVNPFN